MDRLEWARERAAGKDGWARGGRGWRAVGEDTGQEDVGGGMGEHAKVGQDPPSG